MNEPTIAVEMDPESWDAGYLIGLDGQPQTPIPASVKDRLAYGAGWIEGNADRQAGISRRRQPPKSAG